MDLHGRAVAVEADFDQPVGCRRAGLDAALTFLLPLLGCGDGGPYFVEHEGEPCFEGAESVQVGRQVGHVPSLHQNSNRVSTGGMVRRKVEYLTGMQERILSCIRQAITEDGEAPTVGEIADRVGLKSWSSVHYQLRELEAKGAIVREPGRARGIRLA
jgi:DNA-binding transcriptional ArsR family regulator